MRARPPCFFERLGVVAVPRPDRVVNIIAASRVGLNAVCMALLVVAEAEDVAVHAERLETTVGILELLFILLGQSLLRPFFPSRRCSSICPI